MTSGLTLWLQPALPLLGALAILASRRSPPKKLAVIAAATLVGTLLCSLYAAQEIRTASWTWWGPHFAPEIGVAGISRAMIVLVPLIALPVAHYATVHEADRGLPRLLALLLAFTAAMELLALADDFLTLLVGWELVGACSWALIGHQWTDPARLRAARNAFLATRSGDLGLYIAAAAAFSGTGSLRFDALADAPSLTLNIVAGGILVAAAAKSAQLPFSSWLFAAMAGPTAASALLHSATMVAAGAYLLARLAPLLAANGWFTLTVAALGLMTAIAGGIVASVQHDLKKALAASTSAQYGLMLVAIGSGFIAVAALHLIAHALFKALLFLGAGIALNARGTLDLGRLRLSSAPPLVAALFGVGALALAGVPPLGAGYTKEQIVTAAEHAIPGAAWLTAGVLAAGFLSAFYAGRLQLLAFGRGVRHRHASQNSRGGVSSLVFLAAVSIGLGVLWIPDVANRAAVVLGARAAPDAPDRFLASLATIAAAAGLCWTLYRRNALLSIGVPHAAREFVADWFGTPRLAARGMALGHALAMSLAAFDDRVVDAGIRTSGRIADWTSKMFARSIEIRFDGMVESTWRFGVWLAHESGVADEEVMDRTVENAAQTIGVAGGAARRLQTGLTQHYYVIVAVGVLLLAVIAAAWRFTSAW